MVSIMVTILLQGIPAKSGQCITIGWDVTVYQTQKSWWEQLSFSPNESQVFNSPVCRAITAKTVLA